MDLDLTGCTSVFLSVLTQGVYTIGPCGKAAALGAALDPANQDAHWVLRLSVLGLGLVPIAVVTMKMFTVSFKGQIRICDRSV